MTADQYMSAKEFARFLRKNLTPEETIMWGLLRNRHMMGYKFLRQHPVKIWETNGRYRTGLAEVRKLVFRQPRNDDDLKTENEDNNKKLNR